MNGMSETEIAIIKLIIIINVIPCIYVWYAGLNGGYDVLTPSTLQ